MPKNYIRRSKSVLDIRKQIHVITYITLLLKLTTFPFSRAPHMDKSFALALEN